MVYEGAFAVAHAFAPRRAPRAPPSCVCSADPIEAGAPELDAGTEPTATQELKIASYRLACERLDRKALVEACVKLYRNGVRQSNWILRAKHPDEYRAYRTRHDAPE